MYAQIPKHFLSIAQAMALDKLVLFHLCRYSGKRKMYTEKRISYSSTPGSHIPVHTTSYQGRCETSILAYSLQYKCPDVA